MAKKAKKTSARRARKTGGKKSATTARAARFSPDSKIVMLTKDNPRRPKTVQHARYAALLRYNNKKVEALPERDHTGLILALRYAVQGGHARVTG